MRGSSVCSCRRSVRSVPDAFTVERVSYSYSCTMIRVLVMCDSGSTQWVHNQHRLRRAMLVTRSGVVNHHERIDESVCCREVSTFVSVTRPAA